MLYSQGNRQAQRHQSPSQGHTDQVAGGKQVSEPMVPELCTTDGPSRYALFSSVSPLEADG